MIYFNEKPPGLTTAEEDSDTWLNLFFISEAKLGRVKSLDDIQSDVFLLL